MVNNEVLTINVSYVRALSLRSRPDASIEGAGLAPTPNDLALRWFDYWLKGIPTGVDRIPPVIYFVMAGGDRKKTFEGRMNHGGECALEILPAWRW